MSLERKRPAGRGLQRESDDDTGGFTGKTERILHLILANVDDLIAVVDLKGRRLYNSPSYGRILGNPNELRGTDSFGEIHPDDRATVQRAFDETVKTGIGRRIEYRFLLKDGTVRHIESRGNAIVNREGAPERIVIVSRDITDRKRAEKERSLLYSAVEQIAESIIITTLDGSIQYVNPAFERISGYDRTEVVGKNPRLLRSGVHNNEFYKKLWVTLLRGEVWSGQITNKRKDGSLYQEEVVISPVRDGSGEVANYVAVQRDVTREREIERHMYEAQKMESLAQLAGGMAHDFNNVMNVIQGALILLKGKVADPVLQRFVALSEEAVQRGTTTAKELAAFARKDESRLMPISIADLIRELRDALHRSIEKGIEIESEMEDQLPPLEGDGEKLFQGMLTICINARDAILAVHSAAPTGKIRIKVVSVDGRDVHKRFPDATAEKYVRISIGDNGVGMTEDVRQRIFEPFASSRDQEKGRGLGLAMTYAIVKGHRGFIDVESETGVGTTFSLYLPAIHVELQEPLRSSDETIRGGSETILLIEDEEALRLLLEAVLVARGYRVMTAADGEEGLALYKQHHDAIDVVVTDMGLPKHSGQDLFLKMVDLNPAAKVVFMSGYVDPTLKSKLYVAGAKAFIPKPFRPEDVLRKLREVLDLKE